MQRDALRAGGQPEWPTGSRLNGPRAAVRAATVVVRGAAPASYHKWTVGGDAADNLEISHSEE